MRLFFLLIFLLYLSSCVSANVIIGFSEGPELQEPVIRADTSVAFQTFTVERGHVENRFLASGSVRVDSIGLGFEQYNMEIGNIYVIAGETVKKGQLLASLDTTTVKEQIQVLRNNLSKLNELNILETNRENAVIRLMELQYNDMIQEGLDATNLRNNIELRRLANTHAAQNRDIDISNIREDIQELEESIEGTEIFAPSDGVIILIDAGVGTIVKRDMDIIYMADLSSRVFIEGHLTFVMTFDFLWTNQFKTYAYIGDSFGNEVDRYELELRNLTPEERRYYNMTRTHITNADARLPVRYDIVGDKLPSLGEHVVLVIYTVLYEDVLRIPIDAYFVETGVEFVQVVGTDGSLTRTPITATTTTTYVAVHSGLNEGDVVFVGQ